MNSTKRLERLERLWLALAVGMAGLVPGVPPVPPARPTDARGPWSPPRDPLAWLTVPEPPRPDPVEIERRLQELLGNTPDEKRARAQEKRNRRAERRKGG